MFKKLLGSLHRSNGVCPWDFVSQFGPQATYGPQYRPTIVGKHHRFDMTATRAA